MKNENLYEQEKKQAGWFDKHYSQFSKENYKLENWRLSMLNRIFETPFKSKVKTYLDIGCGATGYTTIEAAKRNNWLSFGVDISIEAMLRANNLAKKQGVDDRTAFLVCSAESLPFRPGSIDYISAISVLEHLEADEKAIRSLYAILKENRYLYICVPNTYKRMWPFLWPIYLYLDHQIGHKRHYSIEALNKKMEKDERFEMEEVFYNAHLIKLFQLILDKFYLLDEEKWWVMEKRDINKNHFGIQLNAIYRKK
ncbi:MAG: class I SAM-dependent methyltransferase [bacterium]